jgi:hypothetical protein
LTVEAIARYLGEEIIRYDTEIQPCDYKTEPDFQLTKHAIECEWRQRGGPFRPDGSFWGTPRILARKLELVSQPIDNYLYAMISPYGHVALADLRKIKLYGPFTVAIEFEGMKEDSVYYVLKEDWKRFEIVDGTLRGI